MDWKVFLIFGIIISSIIVIYYCYRNYYKEGFQSESSATVSTVSTDTFAGSTVIPTSVTINGSIVSLQSAYTSILNTITDYKSFVGLHDATIFNYFSPIDKTSYTIYDKPIRVSGVSGKYWYPYIGQYTTNPDFYSYFDNVHAIIDMNVYNSNISRYENLIRPYITANKSIFLNKRSLARPSLMYCNIDLVNPPAIFNATSNDSSGNTVVVEDYITSNSGFDGSHQSWFTSFIGTARPNFSLYPQSDNTYDTSYRIFYSGTPANDKPPNFKFAELFGDKAGRFKAHIPDYRDSMISMLNEQLVLKIYKNSNYTGTFDSYIQTFKECMFWGSVFTNFNDPISMDLLLNVPYNGLMDGSNGYYSFNLFQSDFTLKFNQTTSNYYYDIDPTKVAYNSNLTKLRSGNCDGGSIVTLTDSEIMNNSFNPANYTGRSFTTITNNNQAYVGRITPQILSKIPSLAHRYITSWIFNRTNKYSQIHAAFDFSTFTNNVSSNDVKLISYLNLANKIVQADNLNGYMATLLSNYASYSNTVGLGTTSVLTTGNNTISCNAVVSNVYSEDFCKRILSACRNYKSYVWAGNNCYLSLSLPGSGSGTPVNGACGYFSSQQPKNNMRGGNLYEQLTLSIIQSLTSMISQVSILFTLIPSDGIQRANTLVSLVTPVPTAKTDINNAYTSINTLIQTANSMKSYSESINTQLNNGDISSITNAKALITSLIGYMSGTGTFITALSDANTKINTAVSNSSSLSSDIQTNLSNSKIFINFFYGNVNSIFYNNYTLFQQIIGLLFDIDKYFSSDTSVTDKATLNGTIYSDISDILSKFTDLQNSVTTLIGTTTASASITKIKTDFIPTTDSRYISLNAALTLATTPTDIQIAQGNLDSYLTTNFPFYADADKILTAFKNIYNSSGSTASGALQTLNSSISNLRTTVGTDTTKQISDAISGTTSLEANKIANDFTNALYSRVLKPNYGFLVNLNINDQSFLNNVAQFYYDSSDGLYEMTTIYDVYLVGDNSVDIRFDKKQRVPNNRINNLEIQYYPQVQTYNRLVDMMNDGSWTQYYHDTTYTTNIPGQVLTKTAMDYYTENLSTAKGNLDVIFNPIYPVNINTNVRDLQNQLSNYTTQSSTINAILTGRLSGPNAPVIPETADTIGMSYTQRLTTIEDDLNTKINTIQVQISGILQSCARMFVYCPDGTQPSKWNVAGMAVGINAALTFNSNYNGNLEFDMGAPTGNIGAYEPTINYDKNLTQPIICGDLQFMEKATALFSNTAFINLSTFTTVLKNEPGSTTFSSDLLAATQNNFYDSNNGPIVVDKIFGFQQLNSNTCLYRWQESQIDPLTNNPYIDPDTNIVKQRTVNVRYQFAYDNSEYQNPQLLPDNTSNSANPNQGFRYLDDNVSIPFGDLYMSLYTWYASATRDLYSYAYSVNSNLNSLYANTTDINSPYTQIRAIYNAQTSNLSTLDTYTAQYVSTNVVISNLIFTGNTSLSPLITNITASAPWDASGTAYPFTKNGITYRVIASNDGSVFHNCDSILLMPPTLSSDLVNISYNFRPGDSYGNTFYDNGTNNYLYNKYRTVPLSYFLSTVILGPNIDLTGSDATKLSATTFGSYTVNENLYQSYPQSMCDPNQTLLDPSSCFTYETDRCKYQYKSSAVNTFNAIMSNIGVRDSIYNSNIAIQQNIVTNTVTVSTLMKSEILFDNTKGIVSLAQQSIQQLYPVISNLNDKITYLSNESTMTQASIASITTQYQTLLNTQRTDPNLPVYMSNQVVPILRALPTEAEALDSQNGACSPSYVCQSIDVMNSLMEQYNLDNTLDDTILRILKAATPSKFACDYLVEVRKKNAGVPTTIPIRYVKLVPNQPNTINKTALYFNGNNTRLTVYNDDPFYLGSNNFTIDWYQYGIYDTDNPNAILFSMLNSIKVTFTCNPVSDPNTVTFNLYINNTLFCLFNFEYTEINRWTYFAIVRYNNIITCYKDGYAFVSTPISYAINSSSTTLIIGNDGVLATGTFFKGAISDFRWNNFDALYTGNLFNAVPSLPLTKQINTRLLMNINPSYINTLTRSLTQNTSGFLTNRITQLTTQSIQTNGSFLKKFFVSNNQNSYVVVYSGKYYISHTANHRILRVDSDGLIPVIGTGIAGYSPGTSTAIRASINTPTQLCSDNSYLYFADTGNNRICYYDGGTITEINFYLSATSTTPIALSNIKYFAVTSNSIYFINSGILYRAITNKPATGYTLANGLIAIPIITPFASSSSAVYGFINTTSITSDNSGNIYVADSGAKSIIKLNLTSLALTTNFITSTNGITSIYYDTRFNKLYVSYSGSSYQVWVYNILSSTVNNPNGIPVAGNSSTQINTELEGYSLGLSMIPQNLYVYNIYNSDTLTFTTQLFVNDSKRLCLIQQANIPSSLPTIMYNFNAPSTPTVPSYYISVGSVGESDFIFTGDFTIEWFMFMVQYTTLTHTVFSFDNVSRTTLGVSFDVIDSTSIHLNITVNGVTNSTTLNYGEYFNLWVQCALVCQNKILYFYKNGVIITSIDISNSPIDNSSSQLTIANTKQKSTTTNFYGSLANFYILNGVAKTFDNNNIVANAYTSQYPNLVLALAAGTNNKDYSFPTTYITNRNTQIVVRFPTATTYNWSKIILDDINNSNPITIPDGVSHTYSYTPPIYDLGSLKNINVFRLYGSSGSIAESLQEWTLLGSSDNINWLQLHQQTTPYSLRTGYTYPKINGGTEQFHLSVQQNLGGDILQMVKRFEVARNINDCSMIITSNAVYDASGDAVYDANGKQIYAPGVTSISNVTGYYIQDNTPFVTDSSGSDVSGYQFIGGALSSYKSDVSGVFDSIITSASTITNSFYNAYANSRTDTYAALGKLNTTGFNCAAFNTYDTLRAYITTTPTFTDSIFDSYPYSNAYMTSIQHFAIAGSNLIDIVFTKQPLTLVGTTLTAGGSVTAGARYQLSVTNGFCDLAATFISDILPFGPEVRNTENPIFNDYPNKENILGSGDSFNIINSRAISYKDRLHQTEKMVSGTRTPDTTVTPITLPTFTTPYDALTGLRNISDSNVVNATTNKVEYLLNNGTNLPIGKKCYIVHYKSATEVNTITPATLDTTSFKEDITTRPMNTLITNFRSYFLSLYPTSKISKVYGYLIVNKILTVSVGIEYFTDSAYLDASHIDYTKVPNIQEFGNQLYYRVVFDSSDNVLAFEPTASRNDLTTFTDTSTLVGTKNSYVNSILWKNIKFTPLSENIASYSVSQIECYNGTIKQRIDSISLDVNGGNPSQFNLLNLIDGVNTQASTASNVNFFTHSYLDGSLIANFNTGKVVNGFSFMTGYSLQNPHFWKIYGSCDGVNYVLLYNQSTDFTTTEGLDNNGNSLYNSFYRTRILYFDGITPNSSLPQPLARTSIISNNYGIKSITITGKSSDMIGFQLINITFYNNNIPIVVTPTDTSKTNLLNPTNYYEKNPSQVQIYDFPVDTSITINFNSNLNYGTLRYPNFNGISFISGNDVNKCLLKWNVSILATTDGTTFTTQQLVNQNTVYTNTTANYPHYFCRTPIFYQDGQIVEVTQPAIYQIDNWPISKFRLRPIYMYGPSNSSRFELSQIQFFKDATLISPPVASGSQNEFLVNKDLDSLVYQPPGNPPISSILPTYVGDYLDPATNIIEIDFTSAISFNGISLMSGSTQFTCIQMFYVDVYVNGLGWINIYSNDTEPYTNINYPSAYFRTPIIYFDRNISIDSNTKYYLFVPNTSGTLTLMEVKIQFSVLLSQEYVTFSPVIPVEASYFNKLSGFIIRSQPPFLPSKVDKASWASIYNANIGNTLQALAYDNTYNDGNTNVPSGTNTNTINLYQINQNINETPPFLAGFNYGNPPYSLTFYSATNILATWLNIYTNNNAESSILFNNKSSIHLQQIYIWTPPTTQGFTNPPKQHIHQFIFTTNKPFDMKLFHLIRINNKALPKILYTIQKKNDRFFVIYLNAYIDVVGYSITTNLYSKEADSDSWNFYGLKKHDWILLDKQNNLDIPNDRSKPLFFYFEKYRTQKIEKEEKRVKALPPVVEDEKDTTPDVEIFKKYYTTKINPFSKPVFKMYMYDGSRKIYLVFDEYDMNGRLVGKDLIIGFVIDKHTIKKPIMYQTMDGTYSPFDLSKKDMAFYWKKHIGLDLNFNRV